MNDTPTANASAEGDAPEVHSVGEFELQPFEPTQAVSKLEPIVSVHRYRGDLAANAPARELLGNPEFVELFYDPQRRAIGLRATKDDNPRAVRFRKPAAERPASLLPGQRFMRQFGLDPQDVSGSYRARLVGDTLVFQLGAK